jgi:hypothetical protein
MARTVTHYIHELRQKLEGMEPVHRALIEKTSVTEPSLKSDLYEDRWRMNLENQLEFAGKYNFKIDWPQWRDHDATQDAKGQSIRATAAKFLVRWREYNRRDVELILEAGTTECLKKRFASIRVDCLRASQHTYLPGDPFVLCDEGDLEPRDLGAGFKVGLQRYELDFQLSSTTGAKLIDHGEQQRLGNIDVIPRGTADKRRFICSTPSPPMRGHWEDAKPLANYEGAQIGDVIQVEMRAELDDSFVENSGEPLEAGNRLRLAEFLAALEGLGRPDEDGFVTLVTQKLRVGEKPTLPVKEKS